MVDVPLPCQPEGNPFNHVSYSVFCSLNVFPASGGETIHLKHGISGALGLGKTKTGGSSFGKVIKRMADAR